MLSTLRSNDKLPPLTPKMSVAALISDKWTIDVSPTDLSNTQGCVSVCMIGLLNNRSLWNFFNVIRCTVDSYPDGVYLIINPPLLDSLFAGIAALNCLTEGQCFPPTQRGGFGDSPLCHFHPTDNPSIFKYSREVNGDLCKKFSMPDCGDCNVMGKRWDIYRSSDVLFVRRIGSIDYEYAQKLVEAVRSGHPIRVFAVKSRTLGVEALECAFRRAYAYVNERANLLIPRNQEMRAGYYFLTQWLHRVLQSEHRMENSFQGSNEKCFIYCGLDVPVDIPPPPIGTKSDLGGQFATPDEKEFGLPTFDRTVGCESAGEWEFSYDGETLTVTAFGNIRWENVQRLALELQLVQGEIVIRIPANIEARILAAQFRAAYEYMLTESDLSVSRNEQMLIGFCLLANFFGRVADICVYEEVTQGDMVWHVFKGTFPEFNVPAASLVATSRSQRVNSALVDAFIEAFPESLEITNPILRDMQGFRERFRVFANKHGDILPHEVVSEILRCPLDSHELIEFFECCIFRELTPPLAPWSGIDIIVLYDKFRTVLGISDETMPITGSVHTRGWTASDFWHTVACCAVELDPRIVNIIAVSIFRQWWTGVILRNFLGSLRIFADQICTMSKAQIAKGVSFRSSAHCDILPVLIDTFLKIGLEIDEPEIAQSVAEILNSNLPPVDLHIAIARYTAEQLSKLAVPIVCKPSSEPAMEPKSFAPETTPELLLEAATTGSSPEPVTSEPSTDPADKFGSPESGAPVYSVELDSSPQRLSLLVPDSLRKYFTSQGWGIVHTRGDGNCALNAIAVSCALSLYTSRAFRRELWFIILGLRGLTRFSSISDSLAGAKVVPFPVIKISIKALRVNDTRNNEFVVRVLIRHCLEMIPEDWALFGADRQSLKALLSELQQIPALSTVFTELQQSEAFTNFFSSNPTHPNNPLKAREDFIRALFDELQFLAQFYLRDILSTAPLGDNVPDCFHLFLEREATIAAYRQNITGVTGRFCGFLDMGFASVILRIPVVVVTDKYAIGFSIVGEVFTVDLHNLPAGSIVLWYNGHEHFEVFSREPLIDKMWLVKDSPDGESPS
ncbi:MAG: hypothetical protein LBB26_03035 [Puniceicoccales bacterium]|jgi:hypothetical protein|nr:hypothetical protein [Puniceicoccales bacterium]